MRVNEWRVIMRVTGNKEDLKRDLKREQQQKKTHTHTHREREREREREKRRELLSMRANTQNEA
jgi:hypothetical protein